MIQTCYEIESPMNANEWLELAAGSEERKLDKPLGRLSTDGYRMHIAPDARPAETNNHELAKSLNYMIKTCLGGAGFMFAVNKKYLLEALAGMDDGEILFFGSNKYEPIIIQNIRDDWRETRTAIIMPMNVGNSELEIETDPPQG